MIKSSNRQGYFIIFIFIFALFLRIGYALLERIIPYSEAAAGAAYNEAAGFDEIGKHIALGKGYRMSDGPIENDEAAFWPPGYAFFLGIIYIIFGHSYPALWIIQSIIGALICILTFFIANRLFDPRVARVSAIISAACFNLVIYPAMVLSETLFLLLLLICFIYIYKADTLNSNIKYLFGGIIAGLSVLTRPVILIFFLFYSLFSLKKNSRGILLFLFPIIILVSFWIARNYHVYQRFVPISIGPGEVFWAGHHLISTGEFVVPVEMPKDLAGQEYIKIDNLGYRQGLEFIVKHPIRTLLLELRKVSLFFSLLRTDAWWPHMKGIDRVLSFALSVLFNLLIFGCGIIGIVFSYAKVNKHISWLRRFIFISILSLIPFIVEARYRLTIYPFMIIFAGYALVLLPGIRSAFILKDKRIIYLSYLSMILFTLFILNSVYDLSCVDDIALRMHILKSGIPIPW